MAAGKDANEHFIHHLVLTNDDLGQLIFHCGILTAQLVHRLLVLVRYLLRAAARTGGVRVEENTIVHSKLTALPLLDGKPSERLHRQQHLSQQSSAAYDTT